MSRYSENIIIGAGAAGLFCAAQLGKLGKQVTIFDNGKKIGRKILMSGGGFCNFTNMEITSGRYISQNKHFVKSALKRYTQWDFIALVAEYGIPYHEKELGQLFCDNGAEDIVKMLINTIVYKKSAGFKEKGQIPPVVSLEISNIHLLLFFGQRSDGLYDVKDFFGYDINCKLDGRGDYPTTQYCIMNKRDYAYSSNIIIEKIRTSFMKYDNQGHRERTVFSILEMIKAYDLSKKEELLEVALELCKWLEDKEPENSVHVINRIQCEIRLREISDTEIAELMTILQTDIDQQSQAGIQILMGNKRLADHYIELLDDETKKTFMEYPIYHLYNGLK